MRFPSYLNQRDGWVWRQETLDVSYAHLGGSPYWCWGHELGLNEWGVAIGNEAAARRGEAPRAGILGMELVRGESR